MKESMSIFMELMQAVDMGLRCKVDLETKSLHIDKKPIIENGILLGEKRNLIDQDDLYVTTKMLVHDDFYVWVMIEHLYNNYKYSMPTKKSKVNKPYFKVADVTEITTEYMASRPHRDKAQMMLEGFILLAGIKGYLKLTEPKHWFWQSSVDKDLVVLRKWVSN